MEVEYMSMHAERAAHAAMAASDALYSQFVTWPSLGTNKTRLRWLGQTNKRNKRNKQKKNGN